MPTEGECSRNEKALQYSLEEYKKCWEFLHLLHQDRRHIWTYLLGLLAALPVAGLVLVGRDDTAAFVREHSQAIGAFLTVLWLVGLCGIVHLVHLRKQLVEWSREANRIRRFWQDRNVIFEYPTKMLRRTDRGPRYWRPFGANIWFAAPLILTNSLIGAAAYVGWIRNLASTTDIWRVLPGFLASLTLLFLAYAMGLRQCETQYSLWRIGHPQRGDAWPVAEHPRRMLPWGPWTWVRPLPFAAVIMALLIFLAPPFDTIQWAWSLWALCALVAVFWFLTWLSRLTVEWIIGADPAAALLPAAPAWHGGTSETRAHAWWRRLSWANVVLSVVLGTLTLLLVSTSLLTTSGYGLTDPFGTRNFERQIWLADVEQRAPMADDVRERFVRRGVRKEQVRVMLGDPNNSEYQEEQGNMDAYSLGTLEQTAMDAYILEVYYDEAHKVVAADITQY